jgi:hypothetical protein
MIKSQNADQDYEKIKSSLSSYQGNLDNYEKFEDDYRIVVSFNVKIPQDSFDKFVDYLNKNFKVVESNVRFYVVSLKKTYDELEILKKTFNNLTIYEERLTTMPELPEIETIKRYLEKDLIGRKIKDVKILNKKSFIGDKKKILNSKILKIERKGKMLIFNEKR